MLNTQIYTVIWTQYLYSRAEQHALSCTHIVPTIQHSYLWVHIINTHTVSHNSSHTHAHSTSTHDCTTHIHTVHSLLHTDHIHSCVHTQHTGLHARAAGRTPLGSEDLRSGHGVGHGSLREQPDLHLSFSPVWYRRLDRWRGCN